MDSPSSRKPSSSSATSFLTDHASSPDFAELKVMNNLSAKIKVMNNLSAKIKMMNNVSAKIKVMNNLSAKIKVMNNLSRVQGGPWL